MSLMGLDLGGSGAKAIVFNAQGSILAQAKSEYSLVSPRADWLEFDPNVQWDCMCRAIRQVAHCDSVRPDPIRAFGISVAGEAVFPADRQGRPLYNSIATPDLRGSELIDEWEQRLGARRIYEITGQPLDGIYSLMRALWFREFMPDVFRRTWKFLLWQEHLLMRMGLPPSLDFCNASRTMAFDITGRDWSAEILGLAGIGPALFAPPAPSGTVIGEIGARVAAELGLPAGVLAVSGGFDQCCAALGAGVIQPGMTSIGTGSVEAVGVASSSPLLTDPLREGSYFTSPHTVAGLYLTFGCSFAAGSLFRWYTDTLAGDERHEAESSGRNVYELIAQRMPAEPTRLLVLPHFAGAFSPVRDAHSKGAVLGLRTDTSRGELARALLEGTAFELRRIIEYLEREGVQVDTLRNTGGGANSPVWLQIKADVLNRPVVPVQVKDSACLGVAVLAAVATGEHENLNAAVQAMVRLERVYEPDQRRAAQYDDRYALYQGLYHATAPFHREL